MKRDMELIRNIMLAAETMPAGEQYFGNKITPEGTPDAIAADHIKLLLDADFLDGKFYSSLDGAADPSRAMIFGITWDGHEFLDATRDATVWAQTKEKVAKVGGSVSIGTMTEVAAAVAKSILGL